MAGAANCPGWRLSSSYQRHNEQHPVAFRAADCGTTDSSNSIPCPDNLRYQALKEGGGGCALCGAAKNEQPLDLDHILPRSRGGKHELANLQVLCAKCNRTKGNKDDTDFRGDLIPSTDPGCVFCGPERVQTAVAANGGVFGPRGRGDRPDYTHGNTHAGGRDTPRRPRT